MSLLRGFQWVPGVEAVEMQNASGLTIDSKNLSFTSTAEIHVAQPDTWRAIHGLLGLRRHANNRYYLGAPHPQFVDVIDGERIPMLWVDTVNVTPVGGYYANPAHPQILHWDKTALHITYWVLSFHVDSFRLVNFDWYQECTTY